MPHTGGQGHSAHRCPCYPDRWTWRCLMMLSSQLELPNCRVRIRECGEAQHPGLSSRWPRKVVLPFCFHLTGYRKLQGQASVKGGMCLGGKKNQEPWWALEICNTSMNTNSSPLGGDEPCTAQCAKHITLILLTGLRQVLISPYLGGNWGSGRLRDLLEAVGDI